MASFPTGSQARERGQDNNIITQQIAIIEMLLLPEPLLLQLQIPLQ